MPKYIYITLGLDPWLFGGARLQEAVRNKEEVEVEVDMEDEWRAPYICSLLSHCMTELEEQLGELIPTPNPNP